MALEQMWGKLLDGEKTLFEGELFIAQAFAQIPGWQLTFTSPEMIPGLLAANPIIVELADGRRGHATFARSYSGLIDLVYTLDGSGMLT